MNLSIDDRMLRECAVFSGKHEDIKKQLHSQQVQIDLKSDQLSLCVQYDPASPNPQPPKWRAKLERRTMYVGATFALLQ
jgi:hypothetical protein